MTIETSNITSGPYAGNDVTTSFSYTFRVDNKDELLVFETTGNGEPVTLTVDVDYTVNDVGTDGGGTIDRLAGALPTGSTWYIRSNRDTLQETDFESQGSFFPDVHERAFDKLTFLVQQLYDITARSFRLSDADPDGGVVNLTLPAVADRQNRILTFDENGDIAVAALIGTFRGDWVTGTAYNQRDLYIDPATENLYFVQQDHTSTTVAADLAAGRTELLIDAEYVKQQADLAEASATDAQTAQAAAELAETGAETAQAAAELAQTDAQTAQAAAELAETGAETAQAAAELAQAEAEAALYDFKGRYFGGLSADPSVDLNGDPLTAGDFYFNTTDNTTRVYNGVAWQVATANAVNVGIDNTQLNSSATNVQQAVEGALIGRKNLIINGNKKINQRGVATNTTNSGEYNFDRWFFDGTYLYQSVEEDNLMDATFILSWDSDATCEYQLLATTETSADLAATTTGWTSVANGDSFTLSGVTGNHLWLRFTAGSDGLNALTNLQMEKGSVATDFEQRPIGEELALCQRYYLRYQSEASARVSVGVGFLSDTTSAFAQIFFHNKMRKLPTQSDSGGSDFTVSGSGLAATPTSVDALFIDESGCTLDTTIPADTAGKSVILTLRNDLDSTAFLAFDSEL